ncbi:retrotransposon protein [Cucumis melo var. makuwa]|uniref:Retrotransposon protein n=1 Tax=Cucumis melo var. makuwa TaxID=1194695 RepID=A0A5A7V967_CUCMM|nr:retrotransposon protein [Cucumis melo var. makuwa]TYK05506.1 retrotransposon protein [Cucumis melo var. makuwa]
MRGHHVVALDGMKNSNASSQNEICLISHPPAKGLLHISVPYYDDLSYVFDKDRAMGARSETFADVGSNVSNMFNDDIPLDDSHDQDIPMMYSQGVHMSPDEMFGIRAGQAKKRETEVELRVEVVKQLQDIPELQSQDRAKLMQILFRSVEAIEGFLSISTNLYWSIAIFSCKIKV